MAEGRTTIEMATQRAVVLDRLGRYSDAVHAYKPRRPRRKAPTAIERCKYLNNMAGLLAEIGRHDEAIVALDEAADLAAQLGPSAQAIVAHNHAGALLAAGRVATPGPLRRGGSALRRSGSAAHRTSPATCSNALLALRLGDEAVEAANA